MRYDKGTRIFTRFSTPLDTPVWVPNTEFKSWDQATYIGDLEGLAIVHNHDGEFEEHVEYWTLRERKLHRLGDDHPIEPVPPTHGAPKGIGLSGILSNGGMMGRA